MIYFEYIYTDVRIKGRIEIHMRALVETMVRSKRWRSEESIATTKLDHLDHLSSWYLYACMLQGSGTRRLRKKEELPYDRG